MTGPLKAIERPEIPLNGEQLKRLAFLCDRTLRSQPALEDWLVRIPLSHSVNLPFLPIRCFRFCHVSRFPETSASSEVKKRFLSSGSTQVVRATHSLGNEGLNAYKISAWEGFQAACLRLGIPEGTPLFSLVPPADVWADSSLAAMVSYWQEAGVPVHFVDTNSNPQTLALVLRAEQKKHPQLRNFILFGTSLHHLHVCQWQRLQNSGEPFIDADNVWLFDTGGTKGRTQHTTQEELHAAVRQWFTPHCKVHLLSEYGMCELASQAYSLSSPHSGIFACAPQLHVFALSPSLDVLLPAGEKGFLGFVDLANVDSWPCLITEDLGTVLDSSHTRFVLEGRAPDATVKGCSLNVRSTHRFDLDQESNNSRVAQKEQSRLIQNHPKDKSVRTLFTNTALLEKVDRTFWTPSAMADLEGMLQFWNSKENERKLVSENALAEETIAIVSAANTPIAWLFPAVHAWLMGAESVRLHLPSLRQDDPLSRLVRGQTRALAAAFNAVSETHFVHVEQGRILLEPDDAHAHRILLFGSDETLATVSEEMKKRHLHQTLIGLGDFQNCASADDNTKPDEIALMCSRWWGRGCLTPVLLSLPEHWPNERCRAFVANVFSSLQAQMARRWKEAQDVLSQPQLLQQFAHQHNAIEARVLCLHAQWPLEFLTDSSTGVAVANLTHTKQTPEQLRRAFKAWGGCGWLTIVRGEKESSEIHHTVSPTLWDEHQGNTWKQWLLKKE